MNQENIRAEISEKGIELLNWAGEKLTYGEFLDLVQESIKWGPIPNLEGDLCEIYRESVSEKSWYVLLEMEEWTAAVIFERDSIENACIVADAALIELILLAIRNVLRDSAGRSRHHSLAPAMKDRSVGLRNPPIKKKKTWSDDYGLEPR